MKILITYEFVPEETNIYVLDVTDEGDLARIKRAHGNYGNTDCPNEDDANWLGEWLRDIEKLPLASGDPITIEGCSLAIHSGFVL